MNKERLEEIIHKEAYLEGTNNLVMVINTDDYKWLIEQAERVSKHETRINNLTFDLASSRVQNKRYREAIEKAKKELEEDINIIDCARNAHYTISKALEGGE